VRTTARERHKPSRLADRPPRPFPIVLEHRRKHRRKHRHGRTQLRRPPTQPSEKPPEPEGTNGFSTAKLDPGGLACQAGTAPNERLRPAVLATGMQGAEAGYASSVRSVREEPVVLLGLAVIAVIDFMMGLAF
jgi:hypothetical protein